MRTGIVFTVFLITGCAEPTLKSACENYLSANNTCVASFSAVSGLSTSGDCIDLEENHTYSGPCEDIAISYLECISDDGKCSNEDCNDSDIVECSLE